jgi:hypothetical protein
MFSITGEVPVPGVRFQPLASGANDAKELAIFSPGHHVQVQLLARHTDG